MVQTMPRRRRGRPFGRTPVFLADCAHLDATALVATGAGARSPTAASPHGRRPCPTRRPVCSFRAVSYTTGYGELVPPSEWRVIGGVELLTGILMYEWSPELFFVGR